MVLKGAGGSDSGSSCVSPRLNAISARSGSIQDAQECPLKRNLGKNPYTSKHRATGSQVAVDKLKKTSVLGGNKNDSTFNNRSQSQ